MLWPSEEQSKHDKDHYTTVNPRWGYIMATGWNGIWLFLQRSDTDQTNIAYEAVPGSMNQPPPFNMLIHSLR